jgi:hypothetical protein
MPDHDHDHDHTDGHDHDHEHGDGLTVAELIDILSQHPADAVVEMSIIAPVGDGDDDITVDRFHIDGVMPWRDEDDADEVIWLVGGEDADVDVFLDAIETAPE